MDDWIKIRHTLTRSAKVRGLMRALGGSKFEAMGAMLSWLCWIDEQTTDGRTLMNANELDSELGCPGLAKGLVAIGWAEVDGDGFVYALDFGKHCGSSAKARAETARRVAKCKAKKKAGNGKSVTGVTENCYQGNAENVTEVTLETTHNESSGDSAEREASAAAAPVAAEGRDIVRNPQIDEKGNAENVTKVTREALPEREREREFNKDIITGASKTVVCTERSQAQPDSCDMVLTYIASLPSCQLRGDELATCASCYFDELEAVGWVGKNGNPIRDWRATARAFLARWQQNARSRSNGPQPIRYRSEMPKNYDL